MVTPTDSGVTLEQADYMTLHARLKLFLCEQHVLWVGGYHLGSDHHNWCTHLSVPCRGYGGWVAPNIYYLGNAGVVRFGGLRIAGLSGIYKHYDYEKSML